MKVLIVHNSLGAGGAERSLAEFLPGLCRRGVEPVIACLYESTEGVQSEVQRQGFDLRFLSARTLVARVRQLRWMIAEERPDLLHTAIFDSDIAGRLAAFGGPPVLTSLINTSYDPIRRADPNVPALGLWAARTVDSWTSRHLTARFHAITKAVKDAAVKALKIPPDRITVIERGRDPARLGQPTPHRRQRARAMLGLRDDDEVVLSVARQEYQKGQRYLLDAVRLLIPTRNRLVLLVAGRRGHASSALEQICRRDRLEQRVRFLGHRDDVPELLAAADIFAFPSLYEGLGGALIEAMAMGLPIVASDLPAIREVVVEGQNALLARPRAVQQLATSIATLLDDSSMAGSFGACSRTIFEQRFTTERSTPRMIALYHEVAGSRDLRLSPSATGRDPLAGDGA